MKEDPKAQATVDGKRLIVESCPWCGKRHTHGLGDASASGTSFGHRLAHCEGTARGNARGYHLVAKP
jgi:hypothetical protein